MKEVNIRNKRARYDYEITDEFVAGMELRGTEIKSIRMSQASIKEGFCYVKNGEVFIRNMNIAEYQNGSYTNHDPKRVRKLLLNKKEIQKIEKQINLKGVSLLPIKLFISKSGYAKMLIGLGKGKKLHDKRETLKQKDAKRELDRVKKKFG